MHLLLGTANKGKQMEFSEALSTLPLMLVTPESVKIFEAPEEEGTTFAENAATKARFYHERSGLPTLADDSGIIVEALENELGLHTRRWGAGPTASDAEWIAHFLERMKKEGNKRARFVCTLAYIDASGQLHQFEGQCDGSITEDLEAAYLPGLPISAVFRPEGLEQVYSALPLEEKNRVSHRGRAVNHLRNHLEKTLRP